ncbi:MAG TPA: hypothetical protein VMJ10_12590 [Kofleriaceae bacterium]|nr:hypothetical protein [Kofleriaceae bacterium]
MADVRARPLGFELAVVVLVSAAVLVPGIWSYSLVDPWETHYGEVGRMMLQDHDLVHLEWPGATTGDHNENEGFRSKPVLTFWMMAAGLRAMGLAADGGYSGELVSTARTLVAIRLPFVLSAIFGLTLMWWMLARLVSRRLAWLALLVVGSAPMFALISRQGIPDMPLCATVIGALALFVLAMEDGDRPPTRLGAFRIANRVVTVDTRHVVLALVGGFVLWQALYYAVYFSISPAFVRGPIPPALWLPVMMVLLLLPLWGGWVRWLLRVLGLDRHAWAVRLFGLAPLVSMRQLYLLGCYSLLGIGVLAKGPPGLAVVGGVGIAYVVTCNKWRALYDGAFELKRGVCLMVATSLPWHLAMYMKDGIRFVDEYLMMHILDRAAVGVDNSPGTFEYYTSQVGHGMWLWAALLPPALAVAFVRARRDTREGRVRFVVGLWAVVGTAFFCLVQTKFHHYILPIVPAFGILVAFLLDDIAAGRERLHPLFAALGIGIVLLVARDLAWEPERWIEMFVYRYDRPWPSGDPWSVDPSDGFLVLAGVAVLALAIAATKWRRIGVAAIGVAGLAIAVWCLQVYMPIAGTHWGMGDAMRTYYRDRTIYGEKLAYFGFGQLYDDWHDVADKWTFDTFVPDTLQIGQPMTITVQERKAEDDRIVEQEVALVGAVTAIGSHSVEVTFAPGERKKLEPLIARGKDAKVVRDRVPVRVVDADKLLAWQLYWRGENFWSQEEIWGYLPEMKTSFPNTNNVEWNKYLADRTRAPLGRRYFVITETSRITSPRGMLPTPRARDTYEVLDTTSNKFALAAFYL